MKNNFFVLIIFCTVCYVECSNFTQEHDYKNYTIQKISRMRRATPTEFTEFHTRMTLAARVLTGISLQLGLHDASIQGDDVIQELLNLDSSIDLNDVEQFSKTDVEGLFNELQSMLIDRVGFVLQLESIIAKLSSWAEKYKEIGVVNDANINDKFFGLIEKIKTDNLTLADIRGNEIAFTTSSGSLRDFKAFEHFNPRDSMEKRKMTNEMSILEGYLDEIHGLCSKFVAQMDLMEPYLAIDTPNVLKLLGLVGDYVFNTVQIRPPNTADFVGMIGGFVSFLPKIDARQKDILILKSFVMSVSNRPKSAKFLTTGLINGFSDLKMLSTDISDTWMNRSISKGYDARSLGKTLKLTELFKKSQEFSDSIKKLADEKLRKSMEKFVEIQEKFRKTNENAKNIASILNALTACFTDPLANPQTFSEAKKVYDDFLRLAEQLDTLRQFKKLLYPQIKRLVELSKIKDQINFKQRVVSDADAEPTLQKIKGFAGLDELIRLLDEVKYFLLDIEQFGDANPTMPTNAEAVFDGKAKVVAFIQDSEMTKATSFFEKLKPQAENFEKVNELIMFADELRSIKTYPSTFYTDISTVIATIDASKLKLPALRNVPSSIKSSDVSNITMLQFKDHSKVFGEAVKGMDAIWKIDSNREALWKILTDGRTVTDAMRSSPNKIKVWDFPTLFMKVKSLLDDVEAHVKNVNAPGSLLKECSVGFGALVAVQDVVHNFENDLRLVNLLIVDLNSRSAPIPDDVKNVKKGLELLVTLDLSFAKYSASLSGAQGAANKIDAAFASGSTKVLTSTIGTKSTTVSSKRSTPLKPAPNTQKGQQTSSRRKETKEAGTSTVSIIIYSGATLLFLALIGIIVKLIVDRRRDQKKLKEWELRFRKKQMEGQREVEQARRVGKHEMSQGQDQVRQRIKTEQPDKQEPVKIDEPTKEDWKQMTVEEKGHFNNGLVYHQQADGWAEHNEQLLAAYEKAFISPAHTKNWTASLRKKFHRLDRNEVRNPPNMFGHLHTMPIKMHACLRPMYQSLLDYLFLKIAWRIPPCDLGAYCTTGMSVVCVYYQWVIDRVASTVKRTDEKVGRNPEIKCWAETRVKLKDRKRVYSANTFKCLYGAPISAEMPGNAEEAETFWTLVCQKAPLDVVHFKDSKSVFDHYPTQVDEEQEFGEVRLKCVRDCMLQNGRHYGVEREMVVTLKSGDSLQFFLHTFTLWPHDEIPTDDGFIYEFLHLNRLVRRNQQRPNFIAYDYDGGDKANLFVAMEYVVQHFHKEGVTSKDMDKLIADLRACRGGATFHKPEQIMFLFTFAIWMCVMEATEWKLKTKSDKKREKFKDRCPEGFDEQVERFKNYKGKDKKLHNRTLFPMFVKMGETEMENEEPPNHLLKNLSKEQVEAIKEAPTQEDEVLVEGKASAATTIPMRSVEETQ